jgi:hypothetical protein
MRLASVLVAVAYLGCSTRPPPSATEEPTMSPDPSTDGPSLLPTTALLAWLEGPGKKATIQLPFIVTASPLGIESAIIASSADAIPNDALHVFLDEGMLGVPLQARLPEACADAPCAVWLEGHWGPNLGGMADLGGGANTFTVHKYVGPVEGSATHVRIQRP